MLKERQLLRLLLPLRQRDQVLPLRQRDQVLPQWLNLLLLLLLRQRQWLNLRLLLLLLLLRWPKLWLLLLLLLLCTLECFEFLKVAQFFVGDR